MIQRLFTIIVLFYVCFLLGCGNSDETINNTMRQIIQVDHIKNISTTVTENGAIKMFLTAPELNKYNNDSGRFNFAKGLHLIIYNDTAKPSSYCTAKYGDYWKKTGLLLLRDSVVIWNDKGDTLMSNELWWDKNLKKIYTEEPIQIFQPGIRMQGTCWYSNDNLTDYSICNIEGIYQKDKDQNKNKKSTVSLFE